MAIEALTLIPGLPNDISALILSYIPLSFHGRLKPTSKSWRTFFSSPLFKTLIFSLRQSHPSHLLCIFPEDPSVSSPYLFDAPHLAWSPLPPMPINLHGYALCNFSAVSIGPHLYVIGGSLFDTRSFPMDRPSPTGSAFRFDFAAGAWEPLSPMLTARGSFACAVAGRGIVVAGGGSRHTMFGAAGSRVESAERYDVDRDEWRVMPALPVFRAGCVGFCIGGKELWVMGGYGESRTIFGVLPVDDYYRDAVVMDLSGGRGDDVGGWREVGDMWENGERLKLGKIVVVDDDENAPEIFMLDRNEILRCEIVSPEIYELSIGLRFSIGGTDASYQLRIFRYNMPLNQWFKESTIPRQSQDGSAFGFVSLQGELYVVSHLQGFGLSEIRRSRHRRKGSVLFMQIYNPTKKSWRSLVTRTPFQGPLDFRTTVMCTIRV